jgi:hypothetical protein
MSPCRYAPKKAYGDAAQKVVRRKAKGNEYPAASVAPLMPGLGKGRTHDPYPYSREKGRSFAQMTSLDLL